MRPSLRALLLSTVLPLVARCALGAFGQPPAPAPAAPAPAPPRLLLSRFADNRLEIRDARTNEPVLLSRGAALFAGQGEGVTCAVKLKEQPDGADLVFNFMNASDRTQPVGAISLGTFTLGPSLSYYDFRDTCREVAVDYNTYLPKSLSYPGDLYSPAWVLAAAQYAVGVSLQYPVNDYRHDARLILTSPTPETPEAEGGRGWVITFQFNDSGAPAGLPGAPLTIQYPALIRPGEVQTYTVSIRLTARPQEWVRTLLPYREYFRNTYGGVRYVRRTDPVQAVVLAEQSMVSDDSPQGFVEPFRPDTRGWMRVSRYLRGENGDFNRTVLVNPTGLYRKHRENNPPFQMASTWALSPLTSSANDRYEGLPAAITAGKDVGLWWGNSCRVSKTWDPANMEALDPGSLEHTAMAMAELDAAVRAGASTIVLGNYRHEYMPVWTLARWLGDLSARYPEVRFVTEPSACDVLHTLAPTFVKGWNDTTTAMREVDLYTIKNPNTLADFLLPGHETWAGFLYDNPKQTLRVVADPPRVKADMQRYAAFGYVPCFFWNGRFDGVIAAAPSWTTSIPPDLLLSDWPQPLGPGTALQEPPPEVPAPVAKGSGDAAVKGAPGAPAAVPTKKSGTGAKVTVHAAPGAVKNSPNEGEVRPDKSEVAEALRRAGVTSPKAKAKTAQAVPTKVAPSEPPPKKPE